LPDSQTEVPDLGSGWIRLWI